MIKRKGKWTMIRLQQHLKHDDEIEDPGKVFIVQANDHLNLLTKKK